MGFRRLGTRWMGHLPTLITGFKTEEFEIGRKPWVATHGRRSAENRGKPRKTALHAVHFHQNWRFCDESAKSPKGEKAGKNDLTFRHS